LNTFQALAQEIRVSMPELDVVCGGSSGLKPDCLADHKSHSLGFGFTRLLGREGTALTAM